MEAWAESQSPVSLLAVRVLAVENIGVLGAVGGLCLAFVAAPAGEVGAGLSWATAVGLLRLLPYTKPHRREHSRW